MLMITNLIKPRMGKLMFNHFNKNNSPKFCNGFRDGYIFKLTLGSDRSELCF